MVIDADLIPAPKPTTPTPVTGNTTTKALHTVNDGIGGNLNIKAVMGNERMVINPISKGITDATQGSIKANYTFTKSAAKHFDDIVTKNGWYNGNAARSYMNSPLTIREIMSTGKGIPDATFKGGLNWKVPGTFRGAQGTWELGINPKTNVIYHFLFKPL